MGLRPSLYFLWMCVLLLATSCKHSPAIFKEYVTVFQIGDQPEWATRNWNDAAWKKGMKLVPDGQVFWSRTRIDIFKAPSHFVPMDFK